MRDACFTAPVDATLRSLQYDAMADETAWRELTLCDQGLAADLRNLLDDALIPHRTRPHDDGERFDRPISGVRTRFGARASPTLVIDVPASEHARAEGVLQYHFEELERAAERAAGGAPATAAERETDARWIAERHRKQARSTLRLGLSLGVLFILVVVVVLVAAIRPPRLRASDDPLAFLAAYGYVTAEGDGFTLDIDPQKVPLVADRPEGAFGVRLAPRIGHPWDLYIEKPTDELIEWVAALGNGTATRCELHGRAVQLGDLAGRAPGLRADYARTLGCPSAGGGPSACSEQQIDSTWVFLVDRWSALPAPEPTGT